MTVCDASQRKENAGYLGACHGSIPVVQALMPVYAY